MHHALAWRVDGRSSITTGYWVRFELALTGQRLNSNQAPACVSFCPAGWRQV